MQPLRDVFPTGFLHPPVSLLPFESFWHMAPNTRLGLYNAFATFDSAPPRKKKTSPFLGRRLLQDLCPQKRLGLKLHRPELRIRRGNGPDKRTHDFFFSRLRPDSKNCGLREETGCFALLWFSVQVRKQGPRLGKPQLVSSMPKGRRLLGANMRHGFRMIENRVTRARSRKKPEAKHPGS